MASILYLVHRIPFPPNKGDKVRSYNLLLHLAARHRVFLAAFIDDPQDEKYKGAVEDICVGCKFFELTPSLATVRSLGALLAGHALTLGYYKDDRLRKWVKSLVREQKIDCVVVFSSSMVQYVEDTDLPLLIDFVDVDSLKWKQYSVRYPWPLSWIYRREGGLLGKYEGQIASKAYRSLFVTESELGLFPCPVIDSTPRVEVIANGVDSDFFAPDSTRKSPFPSGRKILVFTGAMDYLPNIDAVRWFASEVLPLLKKARSEVLFCIVGRNPTANVKTLASDNILVTGTVDDVRPYLQFCDVVVAPLRIARGIQNKILEALSMARPVVASTACANSLGSLFEDLVASAESAADFARSVERFLDFPADAENIGSQGRRRVVENFSWPANMASIDALLHGAMEAAG